MNSVTSELTQAAFMTTKMLKEDFILRNAYPGKSQQVKALAIRAHLSLILELT